MRFINSLHCEILKIKGSALVLASILGSLLVPIFFTLRFIYIGFYIDKWPDQNTWERLFLQNSRGFTGFLLPIGIILICSLITQIEYKNNNWKQLHITPQKHSTIFLAKFTTLIFLAVGVFILFILGVLINGIAPNLIAVGSFPQHSIPFALILKYSIQSFISILPILGLQYLLSLHFKNFIIAIGTGIVLYVTTMPLSKIALSFLSPYSYALHYFDQKFNEFHYQRAITYFVLLFVMSFIMYLNKKEKG